MSNELLWFALVTTDFALALVAIFFFGRIGLYAIIVMDIIVCNIQVLKIVSLFGWVATLGNVLYGSIFLATDLLSEIYGKKAARQGVWLGFFALIFTTIIMQISLQFHPHSSDFAHPALKTIFGFLPRIALASLTAYLISQHHDVWAFHFWKNKTAGRFLWLRNNASTWVSQAIDTLIFTTIAFWGVFNFSTWLSLLFTTYLFKWMVAVLDTPVVYLGKWVLSQHHKFFGEYALADAVK